MSQSAIGSPEPSRFDAGVRVPRPVDEAADEEEPEPGAPDEAMPVAEEEPESPVNLPRPPNPPDSEEPVVSQPALDAGIQTLDASTPIVASDAAASDAGACSGSSALELCWYLGRSGESCSEVCEAHGGFDDRSLSRVGTSWQGGSSDDCAVVLGALGLQGTVYAAARYDLRGLGCHRWDDRVAYWIASPALARFGPEARAPLAEIACACAR